MFKIVKLSIISNGEVLKTIPFGDFTYIHGNNKKGKTLILRLIDYILGCSEDILLNNMQGLETIDAVEASFSENDGPLFLYRGAGGKYGIKLDSEKDYSFVSYEAYKREINNALYEKNNDTISDYKNVFGEEISFRATSFLNFLEETGIGDLTCVFTKTREKKHLFRAPEIMQFIFERQYIKSIVELNKQIIEYEKEYRIVKNDFVKREIYERSIKTLFNKYGLRYTANSENDMKTIKDFKKKLEPERTSSSGDLSILLARSSDLGNQIKIQNQLKQQSNEIMAKNKKAFEMLDDIKTIFSDNDCMNDYIKEFESIAELARKDNSILDLKDYDATIKALEKEKNEVDKAIERIKNNLRTYSYQEKNNDVSLMLMYLKALEKPYDSIRNPMAIQSDIEATKKKIYSIKKQMKDSNVLLNRSITQRYLSAKSNTVDEEKNKKGFEIIFDYKKMTSSGEYLNEGKYIKFFPGSLSKMAYWQICIYLETLKFIRNNHKDFPVLNLLVCDCLNQPFKYGESNYLEALSTISKATRDDGLQAIVISTEFDENIRDSLPVNAKIVDIKEGLNPNVRYG